MSVPVGRSHGMAQMPGLCDKNLVSFVAGFKAKQFFVKRDGLRHITGLDVDMVQVFDDHRGALFET
jgi:hypothetical protein